MKTAIDYEADGERDAIAGCPRPDVPFPDSESLAFLNRAYERGFKRGKAILPKLPCGGEHEYRKGWKECPICGHDIR